MVTYKSAKGRTISVGRMQVTVEPGVTLEEADETLDQLVKEGFLTVEGKAKAEVEVKPETKVEAKTPTKSK